MTNLDLPLLKEQLEELSIPNVQLKYTEYCELDPIKNELLMFYTFVQDFDPDNYTKTNSLGFAIITKALHKTHEQILTETFTKVEYQMRNYAL